MRNHRIFIAINLPNHTKQKLLKYQQEWDMLPVRWTKEISLHITLVFIGHVDNEQMLDICKVVKEVGHNHQPFEIRLNKIELGPPGRAPRMIWASGEKNAAAAALKDNLERSLLDSNNSGLKIKEVRAFSPHITLARIRQMDWKSLASEPNIAKEIDLSFSVDSMEVTESQLFRDGSKYSILESVLLGE